jgi:hypothetical protein
MVTCPECAADAGDARPGRMVCPSCGIRFDLRRPTEASVSPFRVEQGVVAEVGPPPPSGAFTDTSTRARPRDLIIRRVRYPDLLVPLATLPFGVILLALAGLCLSRIGTGFGTGEALALAVSLSLGPLALWLAAMHLWGSERIWIERTELCRRRSVGCVGFTQRLPLAAIEAWDVELRPRGLAGTGGFFLAGRLAGDRPPLQLGADLRLERGDLEWLARHLEDGIRLARENMD